MSYEKLAKLAFTLLIDLFSQQMLSKIIVNEHGSYRYPFSFSGEIGEKKFDLVWMYKMSVLAFL